jgi:MOSC domain-containing protein YiiM
VEKLKEGTLIEDMGKLGIISKVITSGTLKTDNDLIKWRNNYEIYYADGSVAILGETTLHRLIEKGDIKVL